MIKIKIGKRTFRGIYRWDEITLQRFCNLAAIEMPKSYEAYIVADGKFNVENIEQYLEVVSKITDKEIKEEFPAYYRKVISCLSNAPLSFLNLIPDELIEDRYNYYFKPFVASLLYHSPVINFMGELTQYEPEQKEYFRIGSQKFYLPKIVRVEDQLIPLAEEPIITFAEASDIFRGMKVSKDDVKRLCLFMAIYCRKKREVYDEKKVLQRQYLFMKAPMSIVWNVFFYTCRRIPESGQIIQLFGRLPKQMREVKQLVRDYKSSEALV